MNKQGFLLIELMIVVAAFCTVVMFTVTNFNYLNRILVRCEVDKLHAATVYASRCAQTMNKECTLSFDTKNNSYTICGHHEKLAKGVVFGFLPDAYGPPSAPHNLVKSPVTYQKEQIVFYPSGIMQAGTVYLTDEKKSTMYALSSPISQFSYVRKYRYDKKWEQIKETTF